MNKELELKILEYQKRCRAVCEALQVQKAGAANPYDGFDYYPPDGGGKFHMPHTVMVRIEEILKNKKNS